VTVTDHWPKTRRVPRTAYYIITPFQYIYSEALSALAYTLRNVIMNNYMTSVIQTIGTHNKLNETGLHLNTIVLYFIIYKAPLTVGPLGSAPSAKTPRGEKGFYEGEGCRKRSRKQS